MKKNEELERLIAQGRVTREELLAFGLDRGEKAVTGAALFGPENVFDVCMRHEFSYGIWSQSMPTLWDWLNPALIPDQNSMIVPVYDWRNQLAAGTGSDDDWCAVPTYTPANLKGCEIDYCFDPNRYYYSGRQTLTPKDLQRICFQQPTFRLDGQLISTQEDWEQFRMFAAMRESIYEQIVIGDAYNPSGANTTPEDGVANFFENFAARHPELVSTCLTELGPVDVDLTGVACEDVLGRIYDRVWQLEYKVKTLTGRPRIPTEYFVLVMNDIDAECLLRCQSCIKICGSVVLPMEMFTPAGRQVFYDDYNNRLTGGMFGGGFFELRDGRRISIIRDVNVPRGEFYLLVKGWDGPQPNVSGMKVAINNWSEWARTQRAGAGTLINVLANGGMLYIVTPDGICQTAHVRWNWRLFSNAPWLQTRFENLVDCGLTSPAFATLPDLAHATACVQVEPAIQ